MEDSKLNTPAIIELFGHQKMAGMVTEQVIGASSMIRVEVPKTNKQEAYTRLLNPAAIYAINPVTEEVMLAMANSYNYTPITAWDLPASLKKPALEAAKEEEMDDEEEDDSGDVHDDLTNHPWEYRESDNRNDQPF